MSFKKSRLIILAILTIVNIAIFIFRDHFMYQPYADYNSLYEAWDENSNSKWKQVANDYTADELKEAKKITDSILTDSKTINKIIDIGSFLYRRFGKQLGKPSQDLRSSSPLIQFKKLSASPSEELWCGNFGQMFSLFCWSQGITTRTIEIMYPGDHHILNECYVPEMQKWVMIDLTNNFMVKKNAENFLALLDFKRSLSGKELLYSHALVGSPKALFDQQSIPKQYLRDHPLYYYHYINAKKAYSTTNKIKRYFLPVSWYDIFEDKKHSNFTFYLKQIFSLLWVVSLLVVLVSLIRSKV